MNFVTSQYDLNKINKRIKSEQSKWMWIILICCFLIQMIPYCISVNLNNVFIGSDWNIWMQGKNIFIGIGFTIGSLLSAIIGPYIARLFGKNINTRLIYSIGLVMAMIGFMLPGVISIIYKTTGIKLLEISSVIPTIWLAISLSQVGSMIFSGLGVNNLISKWWPAEKRGFALGISFAGSSIGVIWIKIILTKLANIFGNIAPNPQQGIEYNFYANQYATYFIIGLFGLVLGLIVILIACRRPIPSLDVINTPRSSKIINNQQVVINNLSPIEVKKYIPYWLLGGGYLLIQIGSVHVTLNGLVIANTTAIAHKINYNDVVGTGGSIFGITAIAGSLFVSVLNDRTKPYKMILLSGLMQVASIFLLMYSVKVESLTYIYFGLAGFSSYLFTVMPAYISGRLYGPKYSNAHMAILSIFLALGFAIINSVSGFIIGETGFDGNTIKNVHEMFGETISGNFMALGITLLVCMGLGTFIVSICCILIRQKGIQGLLEYTPSKYSKIMNFKYGFIAKWYALKIYYSEFDFRKTEKWINRINRKQSHDEYLNVFDKYHEVFKKLYENDKKLDSQRIELLSRIYFYNIVLHNRLTKIYGIKNINIERDLKFLLKNKYIDKREIVDGSCYYYISKETYIFVRNDIEPLNEIYSKLDLENKRIIKQLDKLRRNNYSKVESYVNKINDVKFSLEDEGQINKVCEKTESKIKKYKKLRDKKLSKNNINEWKKFNYDYYYTLKINDLNNYIDKVTHQKEQKIKSLTLRKWIIKRNLLVVKRQKIDGHYLLMEYINNKYYAFNKFTDSKIKELIIQKDTDLELKKKVLNKSLTKSKSKYSSIFANDNII